MALVGLMSAVVSMAGCGVRRIENGVYHSPRGYRVVLPGPEWAPADDSRADLELRHRASAAAMAVNALCDRRLARRTPAILAVQLFAGIRERAVIERGPTKVGDHPAVHTMLDGRLANSEGRVRIETYVMKNDRCVYDFLYVAPPVSFEAGRADFARFVGSFALE